MNNSTFGINFFSGSGHCLPILEDILANSNKSLKEVVENQLQILKQKELSGELKTPNILSKSYVQIFSDLLEKPPAEIQTQLESKVRINLVVSQPNRVNGKKEIINPVAKFADENNLPVFTPQKINLECQTFLDLSKNSSISIVAAFGQILSNQVLSATEFGFINWHPSLLPKYRGATPIQSALLDNKEVSGLSWINVVKSMDSGEILLQLETQVGKNQTFLDLIRCFSQLGSQTWALALLQKLIFTQLKASSNESLVSDVSLQNSGIISQNESEATFCKKIEKEDKFFTPTELTSQEVYSHFKALIEFPGICFVDDYFQQLVKIKFCRPLDPKTVNIFFLKEDKPNQVLFDYTNWLQIKSNGNLFTFLKTKDSYIQIDQVILENGKNIDFKGFIFGR